ncbi:hypothetical protein FAUST_8394 [Fusarium austroamericanum]|uniref:Uncharacterized protein n=1 Tax=Fusarium austroamericanum TaxID=282268 RepID=A0AAN5Z639_FUSAU|nr:hypothetical protein FAUST_8394 [Fusarium austroamericanum]
MLLKPLKLSIRSSTAIAIRGPCSPSRASGLLIGIAGEGLVSGSSFALLISTRMTPFLQEGMLDYNWRFSVYNCIRSNLNHDCEWAHFTQAKKSHEREGPDSISFAGKNWSAENQNAQFFSMGRLNGVDCTVICRVAMGPVVYGVDGQAMYIAAIDGVEAM